MRRLPLLLAFACVLGGTLILPISAYASRSQPMQFSMRIEGLAESCGDKCREWISAAGMIRADTAKDFDEFAKTNDIHGKTIVLDSEGGSVLGAIALGRAIRKFDMVTTVGRSIELKGAVARAVLSPRGDCESMCAFVLLAGKTRIVSPEANVRVHQIWLGDRRDDAAAASYSAEDLVLVQRDIGKLALFVTEMGGDMELLEIALRIPPWEPMRRLSFDELRRIRLDNGAENVAAVASPASPATPRDAAIKPVAMQAAPAADAPAASPSAATQRAPTGTTTPAVTGSIPRATPISERGWNLQEKDGRSLLVRRHPLTVEGEDIGVFEFSFSCGETAGEFNVSYDDARRAQGSERRPAVKSVGIVLSQRPARLNVRAADEADTAIERNSSASGNVTANQLKTFAEASPRTLTITTTSADNSSTVIRVGNSGVAKHLPRLAAACAKQQVPGNQAQLAR